MKRRIALLAVSALVAAVGFGAPTPVSAHEDVCGGLGEAFVPNGLGLPVNSAGAHQNPRSSAFSFNLSGVGACAPSGGGLSATGTLTGYCGQSGGSGVTSTNHRFSYTSAGTVLVVTGEVNGTVNAAEDPADAGSCTNGTATHFLVNGSAVLTHCIIGYHQNLESTLLTTRHTSNCLVGI